MLSSSLAVLFLLAFRVGAFVLKNFERARTTTRSPPLAVSPHIVELGDSNFRQLFGGDKPVLVDACATFCGPCKLIEPTIDRCAEDRVDSLMVCRYDVESESNEIKLELLLQGAMPTALPSLILVKEDKVLATRTGLITDEELSEFIESNLSKRQEGSSKVEKKNPKTGEKGLISFANQADDYMLSDSSI